MRKFLITAELRELERQVLQGEISYSRMIEILCEKAENYHQKKSALTLSIGQKVYHKDIYDGKELMEVVGIRKNQVELEGDYSGGTHNVCQKDWVSIDGVIFQLPCTCDNGQIECPGCKDADGVDRTKYICAGCKGKGTVICGKCNGEFCGNAELIKEEIYHFVSKHEIIISDEMKDDDIHATFTTFGTRVACRAINEIIDSLDGQAKSKALEVMKNKQIISNPKRVNKKAAAKSIAESREDAFLDMALKYKQEYDNAPWWRFRKRSEAKKNWKSAIECAFRYGNTRRN